MKSKILFIAILFCGVLYGQNGPFYNSGTIGTVQSNGTVQWNVTEAQISNYLTDVLNNQQNISGTINSSTIVYSTPLGYWVILGTGEDSSGTDLYRTIRVELELDSNNELSVKNDGNSESCTGSPCEECKFLDTGGCDCNRTSGSQPGGTSGACNHTVTRTNS